VHAQLQPLLSFPTRRSSALKKSLVHQVSNGALPIVLPNLLKFIPGFRHMNMEGQLVMPGCGDNLAECRGCQRIGRVGPQHGGDTDRKSTRLNSSHVKISYAV